MKAKNQTTTTHQLRKQLNEDIDTFLSNGGKIEEVQSGVSGQVKMTSYSNQSKKTAPVVTTPTAD